MQPLQAFIKAGVGASRLGLPPLQHHSKVAQHVADITGFVLCCSMAADKVCQQVGKQEQLQGGLGGLLVLMAMTQEQQNAVLNIVPGCAVD